MRVVMESPTPATLSQIQRGAKVSLMVVTRLEAQGLIEQAFGGGYVATPDGVKSFCGENETPARMAVYPNGGAGVYLPRQCAFAGQCQVRRLAI